MALRYGRFFAILTITLAAVILMSGSIAWAQDDELAQLRKRVDQLEQEQRDLKAADAKLEAVSERLSKEMQSTSLPEWVTRTKLKGYLRYRHEMIDDNAPGAASDRNRSRLSANFRILSKVNDEVDACIGLATAGVGTPNSQDATLTGGFGTQPINLDLGYVAYSPKWADGLTVLAGKVDNIFNKPVGNSDLIWDTDAHPEGIGAAYTVEAAEGITVFAQGGGFWVIERAAAADTGLWAAQTGATVAIPGIENTEVKVGGGYYDYGNLEGTPNPGAPFLAGNKMVGGVYADDFNLWEGFAELSTEIEGLGLSVFGHGVRNEGASDNQTAWLVGGSAKFDKWNASYNYRMVDQNAVWDALVDADVGATNVKSHKISLAYEIAKNWSAAGTVFLVDRGQANTGGANFNIWRLDLIFKF